MIRFHSYGFSLESESVSFRSKSEGFGAEMNCGVRSKVDPVLSGSVGFGRLPPTQPSIYQRVQSWWFKRMGFLDLVWWSSKFMLFSLVLQEMHDVSILLQGVITVADVLLQEGLIPASRYLMLWLFGVCLDAKRCFWNQVLGAGWCECWAWELLIWSLAGYAKATPCYKKSILESKWTISGNIFFCRFLLRLSKNNHFRVMFMAKFGPTASNFCYENFHDFLGRD